MNNQPARVVSLHPFFIVHPGKLDEFKALMREFVARAASEPARLFYDFTINGDEVFCRELYEDASGALAHLENVDAQLKAALNIADLIRLELHGPAAELDKLREPLAGLHPAWFVRECGVE
jgi:quinol monooxygenase YgiN